MRPPFPEPGDQWQDREGAVWTIRGWAAEDMLSLARIEGEYELTMRLAPLVVVRTMSYIEPERVGAQ